MCIQEFKRDLSFVYVILSRSSTYSTPIDTRSAALRRSVDNLTARGKPKRHQGSLYASLNLTSLHSSTVLQYCMLDPLRQTETCICLMNRSAGPERKIY